MGEELVEHGDLLHDVVADLGDLGEEEEGEETGDTAETGGEGTAGCVLDSGRLGCSFGCGRRTTWRRCQR